MSKREKQNKPPENAMTRRHFLGATGAAAAAFTIVPRHVLGGPGFVAPSKKVNLAMIGVGGQGTFDMSNFLQNEDVQVVAVCDVYKKCDYSKFYFGGFKGWEPAQQLVNEHYAKAATNGKKNSYKGCDAFTDFYEMLDKHKDIDAISIATTDNLHAFAAMAGIKEKKHVYCQKPLTHDVWEARQLTLAARKAGVMTQMGNQGRAGEGNRLVVEWIRDGAIGEVKEVHAWTNRPWGYWPQGVGRPESIPSVPPALDWDKWLGPAPWRPYHPAYVPFNWRGFWDFGTGALGDMGCHILDTPVWALNLTHPSSVYASATPFNDETGPVGSTVHYEFPAREGLSAVDLYWYEGGLTPPRPKELEDGRRMGDGSGVLMIGSKGKLLCGTYGNNPRIIPETAMKAYTRPEKTIPRVESIYTDFIESIKTGTPACSNFEVSGPLSEIVLMGNLAVRGAGKRLQWDGVKMEVTNVPEANQYVKREYRDGWSL